MILARILFWSERMNEENGSGRLTIPKELQREMLKFFLKTSIPRKKLEKNRLLSEKNSDRSDKK